MKNLHFSIGLPALLMMMFIFNTAGAQRPREDFMRQKEKIEAHKIAFLTDRLQLTPEEAEKFWPVYNANRDKIEKERRQFRKEHDYEPADIMKLTDEEANQFLDDQIAHEQTMLNYRKQFNEELKSVLPPQKILILIDAEQEFKVELMRKIAGPDRPPR